MLNAYTAMIIGSSYIYDYSRDRGRYSVSGISEDELV